MDADEVNDKPGCRWVAGWGPDATARLRILDPSNRAEKFDLGGEYFGRCLSAPEADRKDRAPAADPMQDCGRALPALVSIRNG